MSFSKNYVVNGGDTLWGIAARELGNALAWIDIWATNPQIEDPDLIYPGETLRMPAAEAEKKQ